MSKLTPYLAFEGQAAEAMRFYEKALGGKIDKMLTSGESPMAEQVPAEHRKRVMHSALSLPDGGQFFAVDKLPGMPGSGPSGFNGIGLTLETAERALVRRETGRRPGEVCGRVQLRGSVHDGLPHSRGAHSESRELPASQIGAGSVVESRQRLTEISVRSVAAAFAT